MDAESVRKRVDILALIDGAATLKKVATTDGGEWAGPCPFCGGVDRFRAQPNHPDGGRWFCRGCGNNKWHDVIDYIQRRDGVDFLAALKLLGGDDDMPIVEPANKKSDAAGYQTAGMQFIEECHSLLFQPVGAAALKYLHNRGLSDDTLKSWAIGFNPLEGHGNSREWGIDGKLFLPRGIVIPCFESGLDALKYIKIRRSSGDPKYQILKGGKQWLFGGWTFANASTSFLFEAELDALLAWQTGLAVGCASIPAGQKIQPEYFEYFQHVQDLILAFDNDGPGHKAADGICKRSRHYIKCNPLPSGKDITEYFQATESMKAVLDWLLEQVGLIDGTG